MALLKPDKVYTEHGLEISEKLITASSGVRYYSNKLLTTADHKPAWITVHNTADIDEAPGTNDAEQYARATYNNNMGDVVVHYYIDETDCWHILADDTVGYHAASVEGNYTSVAIEIIMDGSGKPYDVQAEERGALLAAILLNKYGLGMDRLTTHKRWYPSKYCPAYILPHWTQFYNKVKAYYEQIANKRTEEKPVTITVKKNYLTYPCKVMNITQGYGGNYSHAAHSQGIPWDYPIDDACSDGGRDYFYCPCDEMRIAHIYGVGNSNKTNSIWLESTTKVKMPYGEDFVTIQVIHPNDDTLGKLKVGQRFTRGQEMFLEGNDGNATGYHLHISVAAGKFMDSGWVKNSKGAWVISTTGKALKPEEAFYIDPAFTTVKNNAGLRFDNLPTERQDTLYYVQIGSFGVKQNAEAQVKKAKSAGFDAIIKPAAVAGKTVYRVQIGAYSNKDNAEAQMKKAKAKGFDAAII